MKHRYFIQLSYNGTNYHGWQIQPNASTIQETLENALSTILKEKIETVGAGRTDTRVHARMFFAHFDTEKKDLDKKKKIVFQLNGILPADIAVQNIFYVNDDVHARFDALSRTYEYHIHQKKDPFLDNFSYYLYGNPDIEKMNRASELLFDYTDFTSFSKLHTDVQTNDCNIIQAEWEKENHRLIFTIKANRFLRGMVRAIVGTTLELGFGKICLAEFRKIIEDKDRSKAGFSVPAHGLFLVDIEYPEELIKPNP
ncbi:MAG: tRNA pseudouridine(38-40) synthase TruA [Bacteroidales bacterium]|nr:tRNA pseudouridine(38-40) synthase TruA [Bacteroidales bacterium]